MRSEDSTSILMSALRNQAAALSCATSPSSMVRLALRFDLLNSTALTPPTVAGIIGRAGAWRRVGTEEAKSPPALKEAA